MDDYIDETMFELERFAIGQPVPRNEDPVLLRGEGHYADDVSLPGQAYAVMVRSRYAHGVIRRIDAAAARAMPGVLAVYTAADLAAGGIGPAAAAPGHEQPRRHADAEPRPPRACHRQGAPCRRGGRGGRRRDPRRRPRTRPRR